MHSTEAIPWKYASGNAILATRTATHEEAATTRDGGPPHATGGIADRPQLGGGALSRPHHGAHDQVIRHVPAQQLVRRIRAAHVS